MYTGCASCHPFESNGSKSRPRVLCRGINKAWTEREREERGGEKGKKERGEKRGNVFVLFGSLSGLELARFETDFPLFGTAFNRIES